MQIEDDLTSRFSHHASKMSEHTESYHTYEIRSKKKDYRGERVSARV